MVLKNNIVNKRVIDVMMTGLSILEGCRKSLLRIVIIFERPCFFFLTCRSFSSRFYRANEYSPHSPTSLGWHGWPPVSHQHFQTPPVPHGHLGLADERPRLTLPGHYIVSGLAVSFAAIHTQHELWTTRQSTGEST